MRLHRSQRGQTLLMVLVLLTVGAFTIVPVLSYVGNGFHSTEIWEDSVEEQASADAALLDVIWQIINEGILKQIDPGSNSFVYDFELDLAKWGVTVEVPSSGESDWQDIRVNMFCKMEVVPDFLGAMGERTFRYIFRLDMPSWDMDNFAFVLPNGLSYDTGSAVHFQPVSQNEVDPDAAVEAENFTFDYNGSWNYTSNGTAEYLRGIWGSGSTDIFAVGGSGTILHYDSSWTSMDSGTTLDLLGIWGSAYNDVFAVGTSGVILHYDDSEWTFVDSGTEEHLRDIWGSAWNDVFAVGDENTILHYDGESWTPMSSGLVAQDVIDQSQTTSDLNRQIYGDNMRAQLFEPGMSGALTSIALKASGTGTPPNDLIVELRNATEIYETSLDQSQITGNGNRDVYGDNWYAQVFRAGLSGQLTDVVLRASKVGSPAGDLTVALREIAGAFQEHTISQVSQDSYQRIYDKDGEVDPINYRVAQTFQAEYDGIIDKVALWASKTNPLTPLPLVVELWTCDGDLPGTPIEGASARIQPDDIGSTPAEYEFTFYTPVDVTAGTKYSIVVYTDSPDQAKCYSIYYTTTDLYASGRKCDSSDGGNSWTGTGNDLYFKVYNQEYLGEVPGSVATTASLSAIDITGEDDYEFSFDDSYAITKGEDYALVIQSENSIDASNCYTVAYNSGGGYESGRESSSTDAGLNWTVDETTDLYFQTWVQHLVGYDTGDDIFAAASRSDITTEGEYEFNFEEPFSVFNTVKYAIVVYTSGGDEYNYYNIACNEANVSIGENDAYEKGKEYISGNGGADWAYTDTTGPDMYYDLYFRTWVVEPVDLLAVWGSGSDVFVVGCSGAAVHYDGTTWSEMESGTSESLHGVWGTSSSDVFAVGNSGTILHYDGNADGTWSEMTNSDENHLHAVWGSAADDVFAVGDLGTVLHYDGNDWSQMTSWGEMTCGTQNNLKDIWGTSSSNVYAIGNPSIKYWYIKGGEYWKYMTAEDWVEVAAMPADPGADWYLLKTWEPDGSQELTWMPNFEAFSGNRTYIMAFEATGTLGWGLHYITPSFDDGTSIIALEPTAGVVSAMYNIVLQEGGQTISAVIGFTAEGEVKLISYQVVE